MPKVTEAHLEARRQQVLDAAFACFARNGFHQTTMQDICREAELSPGAVYRYFDGKESIIEASIKECHQHSAAMIEEARAKGETLNFLDHIVGYLAMMDDPEARRHLLVTVQLWAEALRNPRIMDAHRRMSHDVWLQALTEVFAGARDRGEIAPDLDPKAVAYVMGSFWHGVMLQKGIDPDLDIPKYAEVVRAMCSGGFWRGRKQDAPV